ncbi:MAG: thiamine pyrophosphate-binding protein [Deltaproteobacteria bacterium]|nr:thiamine pyrophosphate-binding protein [Deltaproteobacteria bacterium]
MNNADLIANILANTGVRWVFGVPSGPVLPLIESLRQSPVQFVLTATESSAGFMASAVGYLTGVPGVCVSTVGPGATNLTTGVGSAWLDRTPVLAMTCNVASQWLERRVQMRIDHHALFSPLTKASYSLVDGRVGDSLTKAIKLAVEEPPGPVHLDLPEDIAMADAKNFAAATQAAVTLPGSSDEMAKAVSTALEKARRPLIVTGLTFTRCKAPQSLLRFIEKQKIPFVTTLHAKGFLPESHAQWCGVIGRARRTDVKALTDKSDLIVAIGYDPIEINYEEWAGDTPIAHISTERAETATGLNMVLNEVCDLDRVLESLCKLAPRANEWTTKELENHRSGLERALRPGGGGFAVHEALDILREKLPSDAILAYDVGAHTHQIASQWRAALPKTLLATNGWSSMGYGMPAAFAAKLVYPNRSVACVVGDGGFQMTVGELALARRLNLAAPTIVLNDGWLGLMKVKQERKNYPWAGVRLGDPPDSPPHYFGAPCRPAKTADEFRQALEWAFAQTGPSVIEAFVEVASYSQTVFD